MPGSAVLHSTGKVHFTGVLSFTLTLPGTPAVGSMVAVVIGLNQSSGSSSVSGVADNQGGGNAYTLQKDAFDALASNIFVYACPVLATASGSFVITVSLVGATFTGSAVAFEFTNPLATPLDKTGSFASTTGGQTTATVTASGANANAADLVLVGMFNNGSSGTNIALTDPANTGYTSLLIEQDVDDWGGMEVAYKIVSAAETSTASWAWTGGSNSIAAVLATFKGTAGSGAALASGAADSSSATGALSTQINAAGAAADTTSATGVLTGSGPAALASAAADSTAATAALTTAITPASAAADSTAATGALTNFASVVLTSPLYTGVGGILDPNFWVGSVPGVGTTVWYDPTHITILTDGEISSDTNNCQAVVQFFDGTSWWVGLVVITPNMVAYANVATAAAGVLTTAIQCQAAATNLSTAVGALTTQIRAGAAAANVSSASAALTTAIQMLSSAIDSSSATGALPGGSAALVSAPADSTVSSAALATAIQLAIAATDVISAAGGLSTAIVLAVGAGSSSSATGNLAANQIPLAGAAADTNAGTAALLTQIRLSAAAIDLSNAAGALSTQILMLSGAVDTSSAHADFSTFDPIASSASTITAATGALTALIRMASAAISSSAASGVLSTAIQLSVAAATGSSVDANLGNVPRFHFGWAIVIATSQTVQGARQAYIEESASEVAATFFDTNGDLYPPRNLRYRIDDVGSGAQILDWTDLQEASSAMITVSSAQNAMISLTRSHEAHQVLVEITDDFGDVSYARVVFDIYRVAGLG